MINIILFENVQLGGHLYIIELNIVLSQVVCLRLRSVYPGNNCRKRSGYLSNELCFTTSSAV